MTSMLPQRTIARWRWSRLVDSAVLAALAAATGSAHIPSDLHPGERHAPRMGTVAADSIARALRRMARRAPCTVAAVVHYLSDRARVSSGVLYLDGPPSTDVLNVMLDSLSRSAREEFIAPQNNPYSGQVYWIEVRWSAHHFEGTSTVITVRTKLIRRDGAPFHPVHVVEPTSSIVITEGGEVMLLDAMAPRNEREPAPSTSPKSE